MISFSPEKKLVAFQAWHTNRMKQSRADADLPFPCILGDSCVDDPTFLAFGALPCSGPASAVCSDPLALDACSVSGGPLDG